MLTLNFVQQALRSRSTRTLWSPTPHTTLHLSVEEEKCAATARSWECFYCTRRRHKRNGNHVSKGSTSWLSTSWLSCTRAWRWRWQNSRCHWNWKCLFEYAIQSEWLETVKDVHTCPNWHAIYFQSESIFSPMKFGSSKCWIGMVAWDLWMDILTVSLYCQWQNRQVASAHDPSAERRNWWIGPSWKQCCHYQTAEAVSTAVHIRNRSESSAPYEKWHGKKPDVKVFGCMHSLCTYSWFARRLKSTGTV